MAFPNIRRMVRIGSPISSCKLIIAVAPSSRPRYSRFFRFLLRPFVHQGEFSVRYRCYSQFNKIKVRMSDLAADILSVRELAVRDIYYLETEFLPDCVIDGGGNIGLFTLRAAAAEACRGNTSTHFIICEPVPRNIAQIKKHLSMNNVQAEIVPCCLGGERKTIPFYCRGANESSFDASLPYESVMQVPVKPLFELADTSASRILIKLDIEGMEIETLTTYIPREHRPTYIVGELHDYPQNAEKLKSIFRQYGWPLEMFDIDQLTCTFRACSPSAIPLLHWAKNVNREAAVSIDC